MRAEIHSDIDEIESDQWNRLVAAGNPLLRHEFLAAMEHHHCVGEAFGWLPHHLAIYDDDVLVAAMPLYEKHNSYGEFVFDHQWEHAWRQAGLSYFPKLVSAVPYTPATGQRLLMAKGYEKLATDLLAMAVALAESKNASGVHLLFPHNDQKRLAEESGWISRTDVQFHWRNQNYDNFDDFLLQLSSRKRKAIRKERRVVEQAGVDIRVLDGHTATGKDWLGFHHFYQKTFDEKWGVATFNLAFFEEIATALPEHIVLVLADLNNETIAGALMYRSDTHLYGRHWGCTQEVDMLHFELCYYQGIEYAIRHGLQIFEPGAQGEHKIARGFLPVTTCSSHWIGEAGFRQPLADWVRHERSGVEHYKTQMQQRSPYRQSGE